MKTEYELIVDAIEHGVKNPSVSQKEIDKEYEKLKICNDCPLRKECFSCGVWRWWDSQYKWASNYIKENKNNTLLKAINEVKEMCNGNITNENNIWHKLNEITNKLKTNKR